MVGFYESQFSPDGKTAVRVSGLRAGGPRDKTNDEVFAAKT